MLHIISLIIFIQEKPNNIWVESGRISQLLVTKYVLDMHLSSQFIKVLTAVYQYTYNDQYT